jgi:hypothetical protein
MKIQIREMTRQGAIDSVRAWRELGYEYASIINGVPRPWAPKPSQLIFAEAEQRGIELLSLANRDHVETLVAAVFEYVERSLIASQAEAELRKFGPLVVRGGNA